MSRTWENVKSRLVLHFPNQKILTIMGEGKVGSRFIWKWSSPTRNDDVGRCRTLSDLLVLSSCSLKEFDSESSIDSNDLGHTTIQLGATRRDPWVWNKLSLAALNHAHPQKKRWGSCFRLFFVGWVELFPWFKVGDLFCSCFFLVKTDLWGMKIRLDYVESGWRGGEIWCDVEKSHMLTV